MKNFAKKVIMILTCFIIFMTNVNVVGVIKNIDVTGLLRKVEDRSSEVEAILGDTNLPAQNFSVNLHILLFESAGRKSIDGNVYSVDHLVEVRKCKNNS